MRKDIENIKLQEIDLNEFKDKIYSYYERIFPDDERKSFKTIKRIYENGYTQIIEILNNDTLVGFMILNRIEENGFAILDYFAIFSEYRNKGYGTKAIELLQELNKNTKGIFIEVDKTGLGKDDAENLIREKRKDFYENLGFKKLSYDLFLFDVIYMPYLYLNTKLDENIVVEQILDIYNTTVGEKLIKKNCKFIKNLQFEELNKSNLKIAAKIQYEIFPKASGYSIYKSFVNGKNEHFYISYLAYFEDKPVGVVGLYEMPEYQDTVWVSWFGLLKEYRHMGFGKQIFDFIKQKAKDLKKKYLRLYTYEVWNNEAQEFYKRNMDIGEYYYNDKEKHKGVFEGKPKIFSSSLCDEKVELWNNKFINISEEDDNHEESILIMKQDGIL